MKLRLLVKILIKKSKNCRKGRILYIGNDKTEGKAFKKEIINVYKLLEV